MGQNFSILFPFFRNNCHKRRQVNSLATGFAPFMVKQLCPLTITRAVCLTAHTRYNLKAAGAHSSSVWPCWPESAGDGATLCTLATLGGLILQFHLPQHNYKSNQQPRLLLLPKTMTLPAEWGGQKMHLSVSASIQRWYSYKV